MPQSRPSAYTEIFPLTTVQDAGNSFLTLSVAVFGVKTLYNDAAHGGYLDQVQEPCRSGRHRNLRCFFVEYQ